jgi:hypothetical protein
MQHRNTLHTFTFSEWFDFPVTPLYLNQEYLRKKYVDENLSADEVASEIGCAVSTVLKHLKKYGIPTRDSGENIRPKRHLPFGKKIVGRSVEDHKRSPKADQRASESGPQLLENSQDPKHAEGTDETGRGRWHARSVMSILDT